jgi:hypothetical protein
MHCHISAWQNYLINRNALIYWRLYQNLNAFGLLECSAGVSPAVVCRSKSGDTPDLHERLRKSATLETLV